MDKFTSTFLGSEIDTLLTKLNNIDTTPTQDSSNPITSGGVFSALSNKQNKIISGGDAYVDYDNTITLDNTIRRVIENCIIKPTTITENKIASVGSDRTTNFVSVGDGLVISNTTLKSKVNPNNKTNDMTQSVGVDAQGKLWTRPGGQGISLYKHDFYHGGFHWVFVSPSDTPFTNSLALNSAVQIVGEIPSIGIYQAGIFVNCSSSGSMYTINYISGEDGALKTTTIRGTDDVTDTVTVWGE